MKNGDLILLCPGSLRNAKSKRSLLIIMIIIIVIVTNIYYALKSSKHFLLGHLSLTITLEVRYIIFPDLWTRKA